MKYLIFLSILVFSCSEKFNGKHPSYKHYDRLDGVVYDNTTKNKKDLKKTNKKKKIKPEKEDKKGNFRFY